MKQSCFIHKFTTSGNYYIYDVNTNNIIRTSQITYDLIDDYGILPSSDIIRKWKIKYETKLIREYLSRIHEFHKFQGVFSSARPTTMRFPMCEKHFRESLQSKLSDLILNVTERCNLRCKYCVYSGTYYYERNHSMRSMSWAVAKKAIDYFYLHSQALKKVVISFYGGEPLLNFNLIKRSIEYVKKSTNWPAVIFHTDTNGTSVLTEVIMRFLIDNDVALQVSIDGPSEEHDRYRVFKNGKGSFNLIAKNLQRLRAMNKNYYQRRVSFAATITPPYNLLEIYKFFSSNELVANNTLLVNFVNPQDTYFFKIFWEQVKKSQYSKHMKFFRKQYIDLRVNSANESVHQFLSALFDRPIIRIHRRELKPMGTDFPPNGICVPGVRRLFVDVEGNFYPCERVGAAFRIGNVNTGIERRKVQSVIKKYIKESTEDCIKCWAVRLCGLCFSSARKGPNFDLGRKKENCYEERSDLDGSLVLYAEIMERNPKAFDFVKEMTFE
jgi:uncharacterized protein